MKSLVILSSLFFLSPQEPPKDAYVCLNKTSEVYHLDKDCTALKRCTHEVVKTTPEEAKSKYGKQRLCGYED